MYPSKKCRDLIKKFEGFLPKASNKLDGVWTCGYGHTRGVTKSTTCDEVKADKWLNEDLAYIETYVNAYEPYYNLNQNEFDALVSFTYNLGAGNLKKLLKDGMRTKAEIRKAWLLYNKCNGKELKGLTNRRKAELDLFNTPCDAVNAADMNVSRYYEKPSLKTDSIVEALKSIGENSSFINRKEIAKVNNIENYTGTAVQNMKLLNLLYSGCLKKW